MSAVTHSLVEALRSVPEFEALEAPALVEVVGCSANLVWTEGSEVFRAGEPGEAVYIVLSGQVRILEDRDGEEVEVAIIGPGDYFGELSLLLHSAHTKTARALETSELMVVPKESFQALLADQPELAEQFRRKVEARLPVSDQRS